ncbi:hypothetical protein GALL_349880 [mine drainage metagenome]|uniref:Uncharacterized protein n=1 Tax=mine drainage metagenome TaxID=410659 RepID=A0A1J5QI59_9ZZZZ
MLRRRVHVHHELDVVDVDATRRDVRGDEHLDVTARERGEVALARRLAEVPVQVDRGDAGRRELLGELLGLVLGAHEEQSATGAGGQLVDHEALGLGIGDSEDVVRHLDDGRLGRVHRVRQRVVQVALHELVHTVVERRGEEHPLAARRRLVHDPLDAGEEPEVGHVVGLVEDGDLDAVEGQHPLREQVLEATGTRDEDVHAAVEGADLAALRHPAEHGGDAEALGLRERLEGGRDLRRELPGRREDQSARAGGPTRAGRRGEPHDHREGEREGLAGARPPTSEHVTPGQGVREGGGLDRERGLDPLRREDGDER